jgi:hypothetical protein
MRTHVDTAVAVRLRDTNNFAEMTVDGHCVCWGPMSPTTSFFEEDDPAILPGILRAYPEAEIVRVSRVIDIVE